MVVSSVCDWIKLTTVDHEDSWKKFGSKIIYDNTYLVFHFEALK